MFINDLRIFEFVKYSSLAIFFIILYYTTLADMSSGEKLVSVDFEVFGKVQGVFFRKYTEKEANRLGLRGWCMNTEHNSVKGVIEGSSSHIEQMKYWLQKTGSPSSRIDRTVFANEKQVERHSFDSFKIKR